MQNKLYYGRLLLCEWKRCLRGACSGERYVLRSIEMKVPHDLESFLSLRENKEKLFRLIQKSVEVQCNGDKTFFFCYLDRCVSVTSNGVTELPG